MEQSELVSQQYIIHAPVIETNSYQMGFGAVPLNETATGPIVGIWSRGDLPLKITDVTYTIEGVPVEAGVFEDNFDAPLEFSRNQQFNLNIQFTPTEVRNYSAVVTIVSNAVSGRDTYSVGGSGYDPTKVQPPTISLSGVLPRYSPVVVSVGSATADAKLYYTLDGSDPTEVSNLYDPVSRVTVTELGEFTFRVRGYKDGLTPSDIASTTFTVVEKELTATDGFFFDPPIKIGEHQDKTLVLTNVGSRPIEISLIEVDHESFSLPDWAGPVTIPVGGARTFTVRFAPLEMVAHFGMLTIATNANGGNITRGLNGNSMPSDYGVDPAIKNVRGEGASYSVYVTGPGDWTVTESLDWVSVAATPSLGTLVVTVSPNTTGAVRTGNVGIGARTHSIIQSHMDPLIEGEHVSGLDDWFLSEWFGYYNTSLHTGLPPWLWLFHAEHGFLYRFAGSTNESMFFYDDAMGAVWWTNMSVYPFLHVWNPPADTAGTDIGDAWLWYFEGTKTTRSFGIVTGPNAGKFLFFNP